MNNTIDLIKEDLRRHKVTITLPSEQEEKSLYLMLITAKTSKLRDLYKTYGNKVTTTHLKIAKKIFGEDETENLYGIFIDENLQMVFAFNCDFADYDHQKRVIVFKDIDNILIDRIEVKEKKDFSIPLPRIPRGGVRFPRNDRDDWSNTLIKYGLPE